jgi:UV DNA damage repair endonuclease
MSIFGDKMYNLCCISNELKEQGYSFKTMTWKQFNKIRDTEGEERALFLLGERWFNNLVVTMECIEHCAREGWGYRVSSNLFPCLTHPDFHYKVSDVPQYDEIMELFEDCQANNAWQVRLSMHPDQFVVLASENQDAVDKSIAELNHHGWVRLGDGYARMSA